MKKKRKTELEDELRPEYDLHELLKGGVRGKYAERYRAGTNLVLLAPDVAKAFANDAARGQRNLAVGNPAQEGVSRQKAGSRKTVVQTTYNFQKVS